MLGKKHTPLYMEFQKRSRGKVRPVGEVFAVHVPKAKGYMFGRVIVNDVSYGDEFGRSPPPWSPYPGNHLIYLYAPVSKSLDTIPPLRLEDRIHEYDCVNPTGWTCGYFLPVRQDVLQPDDVLKKHIFWVPNIFENRPELDNYHCDEYGQRCPKPKHWCPMLGSGGFMAVDNMIAGHFGWPLPPA